MQNFVCMGPKFYLKLCKKGWNVIKTILFWWTISGIKSYADSFHVFSQSFTETDARQRSSSGYCLPKPWDCAKECPAASGWLDSVPVTSKWQIIAKGREVPTEKYNKIFTLRNTSRCSYNNHSNQDSSQHTGLLRSHFYATENFPKDFIYQPTNQ